MLQLAIYLVNWFCPDCTVYLSVQCNCFTCTIEGVGEMCLG